MHIVAISAGGHTVGLKADGTVVAVGYNEDGQCNVSDWHDIVAISAGGHTVGLKADGTVFPVGDNKHNQCDVGAWRDIAAITTGEDNTFGLKADGTVVADGYNNQGQCYSTRDWRDIKLPDRPTEPSADGSGITARDVSEALYAYGVPKGAEVVEVAADSPAELAGIQVKDIITAVNGTTITGSDELVQAAQACAPGERLTLSVFRQGSSLEITVTLGEKPSA